MTRSTSRALLGAVFIVAGANHFRSPEPYLEIMPPYLPAHRELVALSGAAEIAGGLGALIPATRGMAGWGLLALLFAVFPANIYAAQNGMKVFGMAVPPWLLWLRLPLQVLLIVWVYRACLAQEAHEKAAPEG